MKKVLLLNFLLVISVLCNPVFSQTDTKAADDTTLLGLPGDNLDLYAVLDLFQKSPTIEEFEKSLNLEKTGINNLDLNLDKKVDFIKVVTKQKDNDFTFILQVPVTDKETQDVAVILVSKDKEGKVSMQIVGDPDLYGKDYIVELKESKTPSVTANPAYNGEETQIVTAPATTTTVVVESAPIVQYVYSPAYVPYYPPYYYGYYPPYFFAFSVMAVGIYRHNHYHYHGYGGYGYHGNTTVIHNHNTYNNYNNNRSSSGTVDRNNQNGSYNKNTGAATRPSNGSSTSSRPGASNGGSASTTNRPGTSNGSSSASSRPGASSGSPSNGSSASRPSNGYSSSGSRPGASTGSPSTSNRSGTSSSATRPSSGSSSATRPSTGASNSSRSSANYSQQSRPSSNGASRYSGGGGASRPSSSGASRSMGGGGGRGAGGGRR